MGQRDQIAEIVAEFEKGRSGEQKTAAECGPRWAALPRPVSPRLMWIGQSPRSNPLPLRSQLPVPFRPIQDCRVLVVDDEQTIRDVVADALKLEGYPVSTAPNGAEALRLVDKENPTMVLLDMRMPVLDGWEFSRELRRRGYRMPVVVLTAAQNAKRWAEEIGAAGYLAKPFDLDDLLRIVERFCLGEG